MKQNVNSGNVRDVSTILTTLFICLFACTNTYAQVTKTLLGQQFALIYEANAEATYTMHESFIGDLTRDGVDDGVVNYGVESNNGGNWWSTGSVIFYTDHGKLHYFDVVFPDLGSEQGSHSPIYNITGISYGLIQVAVQIYAKDDPHCCPSIKMNRTYILMGKELVEIP